MWVLTLLLVPSSLASLVVIVVWLVPELQLAWAHGTNEDQTEETPSTYPDRGSDFVLAAALAQLGTLDAQANALDEKLGHVAAVSSAGLALLLAVVLAANSEETSFVTLQPRERAAMALAGLAFLVALVHVLLGWWLPRGFHLGPDLGVVRKNLADGYDVESVRWAVIASIERSIAYNENQLRTKHAAARIGYLAMVFGAGMSVLAGMALTERP